MPEVSTELLLDVVQKAEQKQKLAEERRALERRAADAGVCPHCLSVDKLRLIKNYELDEGYQNLYRCGLCDETMLGRIHYD